MSEVLHLSRLELDNPLGPIMFANELGPRVFGPYQRSMIVVASLEQHHVAVSPLVTRGVFALFRGQLVVAMVSGPMGVVVVVVAASIAPPVP